jgi:hypothetical protein
MTRWSARHCKPDLQQPMPKLFRDLTAWQADVRQQMPIPPAPCWTGCPRRAGIHAWNKTDMAAADVQPPHRPAQCRPMVAPACTALRARKKWCLAIRAPKACTCPRPPCARRLALDADEQLGRDPLAVAEHGLLAEPRCHWPNRANSAPTTCWGDLLQLLHRQGGAGLRLVRAGIKNATFSGGVLLALAPCLLAFGSLAELGQVELRRHAHALVDDPLLSDRQNVVRQPVQHQTRGRRRTSR